MRTLDLGDPSLTQGDLVVSASAGSGKTFTLTVLVAGELGQAHLRAFEILATTFSEAAAADLRERLLRPLDCLSALSEEAWTTLLPALGGDFDRILGGLNLPPRLAKSRGEVAQAARLWGQDLPWAASPTQARAFWMRTRREAELMRVSTLHALALGLLRQGEDPPQDLLDAGHPDLLRLLRQALRTTLDLAPEHPDQPVARRLLRWAAGDWEGLSKAHDGHRDALGHLEEGDPAPLRTDLERALATCEAAFAPFAADPLRAFKRKADGSLYATAKPSTLLRLPPPGTPLDARLRWLEAQSRALGDLSEGMKNYHSEALGAVRPVLQAAADALEALLGALLSQGLLAFEGLKRARGHATFGDLVRRALEGLQSGTLRPPRPKLLLVDEYQDTSRVQDAFLRTLGAERTVRVGDLKQAIYGFRGGEAELLREHLDGAGDRAFRLGSNHRSAPPIVALANRYVETLWPALDPEAQGLDGHQLAPGQGSTPVGFVHQVVERPGQDLPALGDWITALAKDAGWESALGGGSGATRHRALLLRQRTGLPTLLQDLKARGVRPYVLSKDGYWESPGVRLLLAALEAVARPERCEPAAALLRRVALLTDGELVHLAQRAGGKLPGLGGLDPLGVPEEKRPKVAWLQDLLRTTTQDLAGRLLMEGTLLANLSALEAQGPLEPLRARRNLASLLVAFQDLPAHPAAAWAQLEPLVAQGDRGDVPGDAAGADLVIQTVHASKGLEYDDVILPLLHGRAPVWRGVALRTAPDGSLCFGWRVGKLKGSTQRTLEALEKARARRDSLNLLYVALTRAKARLVLLVQGPKDLKPPTQTASWGEWGLHLVALHPELAPLVAPPKVTFPPQTPSPDQGCLPPHLPGRAEAPPV